MIVDKFQHQEEINGRAWLLTFVDIVALMLAFFVMLFSMSNIETETWEAITSQDALSQAPEIENFLVPKVKNNISTIKLNEALPLDYLANILEKHLLNDAVLGEAVVHRIDGLIILSLPADAMFMSAKSDLTKGAKKALFRIGGIISNIGNRIDVRGHTDPGTVIAEKYNTKWIISLMRAAAVANELRRTGYKRPIPIFGFADTRFKHIDGKIPLKMRNILARRVDVTIHPHSGKI